MSRAKLEDLSPYLVAALIALMGFCATFVGIAVTQDGERIASIWAANGITLGVLLLMPRSHWATILTSLVFGLFCANLVMGDPLPQAIGLASANGIEVLIGAIAMNRFFGTDTSAMSRTWLIRLSVFGGFLACSVSATLASLVLSASEPQTLAVWATYFPAHLIGVITLAPVVVALLSPNAVRTNYRFGTSLFAVILITASATAVMFLQSSVSLLFLAFPLLIYAAFRAGVAGTAAALFIFTLTATGITLRGYGPLMLVDSDKQIQIYFLQLLILVANLTVMPIALVLADRKVAYAAVAASAKEALDANQAKGRFLANMSHEIRTPLNGILGFSELLSAGGLGPAQKRQVDMIHSSAQSLLQLLNDILDISKVDAGHLAVVKEPLNLKSRIDDCMALVGPIAAAKAVSLKVKLDPLLPEWIVGDNLRFRQVLLNLLGNAVKFTPQGEILVSAERSSSDKLILTVADQGIGIAADRVESIFEEFVQADDKTAHEFGGTGLGLAISRKLLHLMDGEIRLESKSGQGTTVILTMPLNAASSPLDKAVPTEQKNNLRSGHVLLVDDVEINRAVIGAMLESFGQSYVEAADGQQALAAIAEAAQQKPFDAVLMDVRMPVMDGLEATRRIKAKQATSRLPVIGLTANASPEDLARCRDAGMDDVVTKPLKSQELRRVLASVLPAVAIEDAPVSRSEREAALKAKYDNKKHEALARLSVLLQQGAFGEATLQEIADVAHRLAGSAGMFGEAPFGDEAYALETIIRSVIDDSSLSNDEAPVRIALQKLMSAA